MASIAKSSSSNASSTSFSSTVGVPRARSSPSTVDVPRLDAGKAALVSATPKAYIRGSTLLSKADFIKYVIGVASKRTSLIDTAKAKIHASTPRMTDHRGGQSDSTRHKEISKTFFTLRIEEMKKHGEGGILEALMRHHHNRVNHVAEALHTKLRNLMSLPTERSRPNARSRVDKYLLFQGQCGTMQDRLLKDVGAPKTEPGDLEVYDLAGQMEWIDVTANVTCGVYTSGLCFAAVKAALDASPSMYTNAVAGKGAKGVLGRAKRHLSQAKAGVVKPVDTPEAEHAVLAFTGYRASSSSRSTSSAGSSSRRRFTATRADAASMQAGVQDSMAAASSSGHTTPLAQPATRTGQASVAVAMRPGSQGRQAGGRPAKRASESPEFGDLLVQIASASALIVSDTIADAVAELAFTAYEGDQPVACMHARRALNALKRFAAAENAGRASAVMETIVLQKLQTTATAID